MGLPLIIIVALLLVAVLPNWGYRQKWGYLPTGGVGLLLIVLILMMVLGKL
jgi:hypothetical protein